jgi:hypothetical protein
MAGSSLLLLDPGANGDEPSLGERLNFGPKRREMMGVPGRQHWPAGVRVISERIWRAIWAKPLPAPAESIAVSVR